MWRSSEFPTKIQGRGVEEEKKAQESIPEEEVWEQEELLAVLTGLGRHLPLHIESRLFTWAISRD
jgi:hypothetical protein